MGWFLKNSFSGVIDVMKVLSCALEVHVVPWCWVLTTEIEKLNVVYPHVNTNIVGGALSYNSSCPLRPHLLDPSPSLPGSLSR